MENAVERLLVGNYPKYYRLALSYVHVPSDAMDVVQESAVKALRKKHSLRDPEFADTWLCRIILNESVSFLRKRKREQPVELFPEEGQYDRVRDPDLTAALDALPYPDGAIIRLRYFEDMPLKSVAQVLQMPLNTVKTRLYRALKTLRLELEVKDEQE